MTTPFIRPVRLEDFDDILALAQSAGGGMTNLPADEQALRARVEFARQRLRRRRRGAGAGSLHACS